LLSLPAYAMRLGPKPSPLPLPRLGYSNAYGFNATMSLDFPSGSAQVVLSQKRGPTGSATWSQGWGSARLTATAGLKEDAGDPFDSTLLVTRAPEIVGTWEREWANGRIEASLSWGRLTQYPTKATHERLLVQARREWRLAGRGAAEWGATLAAGYADYSGAGYQRTATAQAGVQVAVGTARMGLSYSHTEVGGRSPFSFDDVNVPRQLTVSVSGPLAPGWNGATRWEFDLDRGRIYDGQVTLERVVHCLVYGLTWEKQRQTFRLAVRPLVHRR